MTSETTTVPALASAGIEALADALVDLGRCALDFATIDRTAVYHTDRTTPESDTDHTVMLSWCACALAARCFPQLDLGLVAQFALIHDAPEIYAGDTPTLRISFAERVAKAERERAATRRIVNEFMLRLSWFPWAIGEYEEQIRPEARFVRALDKVMPKIVHLLDGCTGLIEQGMGHDELAEMLTTQRADIAEYAGEFTELLQLHAELGDRVLERLARREEAAS